MADIEYRSMLFSGTRSGPEGRVQCARTHVKVLKLQRVMRHSSVFDNLGWWNSASPADRSPLRGLAGPTPESRRSTSIPGIEVLRRDSGEAPARAAGDLGCRAGAIGFGSAEVAERYAIHLEALPEWIRHWTGVAP